MNQFVQIGYRLRRWLLRRFRIRTRGVKVMVFNSAGKLLLVRNSYGDRQAHVFPGGGIRPFEKPRMAARREVREEVGMETAQLAFVACYYSEREGKRDTVHLFTAISDDAPTTDSFEIDEAGFFTLDEIPQTASPSTFRRVEEYREKRMKGGLW